MAGMSAVLLGVALGVVAGVRRARPIRFSVAALGALVAAPGVLGLLGLRDRAAMAASRPGGVPAGVLVVRWPDAPVAALGRGPRRGMGSSPRLTRRTGVHPGAVAPLVVILLLGAAVALFISDDPASWTTATGGGSTSDVITSRGPAQPGLHDACPGHWLDPDEDTARFELIRPADSGPCLASGGLARVALVTIPRPASSAWRTGVSASRPGPALIRLVAVVTADALGSVRDLAELARPRPSAGKALRGVRGSPCEVVGVQVRRGRSATGVRVSSWPAETDWLPCWLPGALPRRDAFASAAVIRIQLLAAEVPPPAQRPL